MKNAFRWTMLGLFSLILGAAACSSDDDEPGPSGNGTGGSGGEAGNADTDAGDGTDAGDEDESDAGEDAETDAGGDAGEDVDSGGDGGDDDEDSCKACLEDSNRCGDKFDACMAIQACEAAFGEVTACVDAAGDDDELEACLDKFATDAGQEGQELFDCAMTECTTECNL